MMGKFEVGITGGITGEKDQIVVWDKDDEDKVAFYPLSPEGLRQLRRDFGEDIDPLDYEFVVEAIKEVTR